ncbi:23S rRNA (uracil(1939)-C(5))-methyltransferase RlmD [Rhabdochlamydiaceae symbiont of Dictyostelium giganteum]|uniref:23S rRNA (uracil(1939)-C(5))-methyltransferase RlmD n=1 Tax=Rhabdochlamydiaceae symbiont of Dictyostelium giganteum TaxID=3342349 RepID=UPI00384CB32F
MNKICEHFLSCGGCSSQDIPYEEQLQRKQKVIEELFAPFKPLPIIPCEHHENYRNKMEFSFSQNKAGDCFLGLILKQSRGKVFNLYECTIGPLECRDLLARVRLWWEKTQLSAFNFRSGLGALRTLTFRQSKKTGQSLIMLTVSGDPHFALSQEQLNAFIDCINDPSISVFLQIHQAIKGRPTQFFEMHLAGPSHIMETLTVEGREFTFKISPSSFFQPNTLQAEKLYQAALRLPSFDVDSCVYDLYCGTGTLGIVCAPRVKKVIGIELNPYAVFDGKLNAEHNGILNIDFHQGDVADILKSQETEKPDVVIVDPPRVGLNEAAIQELLLLNPSEILYISCNPKTQVKNIEALTGYTVKIIQPVDQFPHTPHIENICLLTRK